MAARDDQPQARVDLPVGMRELAGIKMTLKMIDRDQRNSKHERECLGGGQPDHERADQPGPRRHGDGAQIS